jgi:hypothetical protein
MTKEQAVALAESGFWETMTAREIATFQLHERKLCMPFAVFHEAVEKTLGRGVWTHEFAAPEHLIRELLGDAKPPTMSEIIELIPVDKRVLVLVTR